MLSRLFTEAVLILLIVLITGLLVSARQWPQWFRRVRSASWPRIPGIIEGGEVSTIRSRSQLWERGIEAATASLAYSYAVNGTYYAGYFIRTFNDEQEAWSFVDGLKGKAVSVSYNPRKPGVSVLQDTPR
jgi:Protein of unknown function (DUF3592)